MEQMQHDEIGLNMGGGLGPMEARWGRGKEANYKHFNLFFFLFVEFLLDKGRQEQARDALAFFEMITIGPSGVGPHSLFHAEGDSKGDSKAASA